MHGPRARARSTQQTRQEKSSRASRFRQRPRLPALRRAAGSLVRSLLGIQREEDLDDARVELAPARLADDLDRLEVGAPAAVRAIGHDRVVGVGHGDDARAERNVLALEAL